MQTEETKFPANLFPARYEENRAVIRFTGLVSNETIFALCDEVDFAASYYYYSRVAIEIDSPGGELKSLLYYISKLKEWREKGIRIETLAMTQCASAAAFMLSLGDLGCRRSMPNAALLYHGSRIYGSNQPLTADRLDRLSTDLNLTDARLLVELMRHLYPDVPDDHFVLLSEVTCKLPDPESEVRYDVIKTFKNRRLRRFLEALKYAEKSTEYLQAKDNLHREVLRELGKVTQEVEGIATYLDLAKRLEGIPVEQRDTMAIGWLYLRFQHYQSFFSQDFFITPEKAIGECLIDSVKE
ncbi:MAG: hypothetical protein EG828_03795 [Deltaproteobacteria bacterium]|nr:hypothetical protein [Deltaproteobacteria bacterium]